MFQALKWWGAGEKLRRLPRFFPLVFPFALAAYDSTCSSLSKRLEQASLERATPTLVLFHGVAKDLDIFRNILEIRELFRAKKGSSALSMTTFGRCCTTVIWYLSITHSII